jgi:membrane protein DedA with SNARE-associated domain
VEPVGLAALAGLILIKEVGLPIPIPGDLLVVGAGIAAAHHQIDPILGLVVIVVAGLIGGCVQFLLLRGAARRVLLPLMERIGIGPARLDSAADRLRRGGTRGVAVARATPGLRIVAIAASALAALPFPVFAAGLIIGNTLFVGGHYLLGMTAGEAALQLAGGLIGTIGLIVVVIVILAAIGGLGWWLLRRRAARRAAGDLAGDVAGDVAGAIVYTVMRAQAAEPDPARSSTAGRRLRGVLASAPATAVAWADAACPACLAIGLFAEEQG